MKFNAETFEGKTLHVSDPIEDELIQDVGESLHAATELMQPEGFIYTLREGVGIVAQENNPDAASPREFIVRITVEEIK